jgi:hypothetical protein
MMRRRLLPSLALTTCVLLHVSQAFLTPTPAVRRNTLLVVLAAEEESSTTAAPPASSSSTSLEQRDGESSLLKQFSEEVQEITACLGLALGPLFQQSEAFFITADAIVVLCDQLDQLKIKQNDDDSLFVNRRLSLRQRALEFKRFELLANLMRQDYNAYVATASFLSPSRIPRSQLPNVQDVPYNKEEEAMSSTTVTEEGESLVVDCELEDLVYQDSLLDKALMSIFRKLVEKNTGGVTSEKDGIEGLLEQGRAFMLQGETPEAQHKMVSDTLGGLMTPVLPPFYRIFMAGIVPPLGTKMDGKQLGPWFYAPFLTSIVTPTFFGFLVGPSRPNRRKDGQVGGLVVEKCKFLQESGCKGLCLHQCKLPAQQFFAEELGLPLTVIPNFVTQECQWSFGETPLPPAEDPSFPKGCLVGCQSRKDMAGRVGDICN